MFALLCTLSLLGLGLIPPEVAFNTALTVFAASFVIDRMVTRPVACGLFLSTFSLAYHTLELNQVDPSSLHHPIGTPLTLLVWWTLCSAAVDAVQGWVVEKVKAAANAVLRAVRCCVVSVFQAMFGLAVKVVVKPVAKGLKLLCVTLPCKVSTVAVAALQWALPASVFNLLVAATAGVVAAVWAPLSVVKKVLDKAKAIGAYIAGLLAANAREAAADLVDELNIPEVVVNGVRALFFMGDAEANDAADAVDEAAAADEAAAEPVNEHNNYNNEGEEVASASATVNQVDNRPIMRDASRGAAPRPPPNLGDNGGGRRTLPRAGADPPMIPRAPPRGATFVFLADERNEIASERAAAAAYGASAPISGGLSSSPTPPPHQAHPRLPASVSPPLSYAPASGCKDAAQQRNTLKESSSPTPKTSPHVVHPRASQLKNSPIRTASTKSSAPEDAPDAAGVLPASGDAKAKAPPSEFPLGTDGSGEDGRDAAEPGNKPAKTLGKRKTNNTPLLRDVHKVPSSSSSSAAADEGEGEGDGNSLSPSKRPRTSFPAREPKTPAKKAGAAPAKRSRSNVAPAGGAPAADAPNKKMSLAEVRAAAKRSYDEQKTSELVKAAAAAAQPAKKARRTKGSVSASSPPALFS